MSPPKIPEPTRAAAENIAKLGRAIERFQDAKARREQAQHAMNDAKFKLGDLQRNPPRSVFGGDNIKSEAEHARATKAAHSALDEATTVFLDLDREVAQAAVGVEELHQAVDHALRVELEPIRRAAQKQVEAAVDALLAATDLTCALNRVIGNGSSWVYPQVPCPLTGSDLAYRRKRADPTVPADWLKYQRLRSQAMDADRELPPAQAAE
jgi:hypothetical protein